MIGKNNPDLAPGQEEWHETCKYVNPTIQGMVVGVFLVFTYGNLRKDFFVIQIIKKNKKKTANWDLHQIKKSIFLSTT